MRGESGGEGGGTSVGSTSSSNAGRAGTGRPQIFNGSSQLSVEERAFHQANADHVQMTSQNAAEMHLLGLLSEYRKAIAEADGEEKDMLHNLKADAILRLKAMQAKRPTPDPIPCGTV